MNASVPALPLPKRSRVEPPPDPADAQLNVGLGALPFIADHALGELVVLPGAFYLELALELAGATDRERGTRGARVIRDVVFENPVVLGNSGTLLRVTTTARADDRVEYTFAEHDGAGRDGGRSGAPAARLVVEREHSPAAHGAAWSIAAFMAKSPTAITAERFYASLRHNGNQYGPYFQRISTLWRAGHQVLGRLSAPPVDATTDERAVRTCLLDAATQLLAATSLDRGQPFMLRSVERVFIAECPPPDTCWAHAVVDSDGDGVTRPFEGTVRIIDDAGALFAELSGVVFAFLDARESAGVADRATTIAVAANITAEPVEDSLRFWGAHFGAPVRVEFAPYNQVFQQLLDPRSVLCANRDGVNVVLLALEEWMNEMPSGAFDVVRARRALGDRPRHTLPNGLEIAHLNAYETDYVYREVFDDQCYLRHGISLHDGDTVIDIGANIGLFTLFVASRCSDARVIAVEPAPAACETLKANCEAYAPGVEVVNAGVSDASGTAAFTFYEKSSVFSGFHANVDEDRAAIQAIVRNTLNSTASADAAASEELVAELTADRLRHTVHECRMTTVSDIIRERGLTRIDLLKVDAERSELAIVRGIDERDWPKIGQIVFEIHDRSRDTLDRIESLLAAKGFRCTVDSERLLKDSGLYNLYATRRPASGDHERAAAGGSAPAYATRGLERNVREFGAALTAFMARSHAPLVLCICPRTPRADADDALRADLEAAEAALLAAAAAIPGVHAIGSQTPLARYPLREYYDAHSHHLARIPYTPACYHAVGTAVFRSIAALRRSPFKVVVLDCDNTLWSGVCGEDGPNGVQLSEPHLRLQRFVVDQMNAGMLVCLCSKNAEQDVFDVFEQRHDMVLKREHLAAWRVNWNSKADNVASLARELDVGLDAFVVVDDNPVECAEMRNRCPGTLVLQLPPSGDAIGAFLEHTWAFDRTAVTAEDRNRTAMYHQAAARTRFRDEAVSLKAFIDGLNLRVEVAEPTDDDVDRISQLTQRTNQFNSTTIRRSPAEVRDFLKSDGAGCRVVRVTDRFGDYGLVGALLFVAGIDRVTVDSFLLSCRVLGRGVEHAVIAQIAATAVANQRDLVEITFRPSPKNAPAHAFLQSLTGDTRPAGATSYVFDSRELAQLQYNPDAHGSAADTTPARTDAPAVGAAARASAMASPEPLRVIAEQLRDIDELAQRIEGQQREPLADDASAATVDGVTDVLRRIWSRVLGRSRVGSNDNFFELGGSSLKAVQVLALIKKELGHSLSIVSLFESPTVALMAAKLQSGGTSGAVEAGTTNAAATRGRNRRAVLRRPA